MDDACDIRKTRGNNRVWAAKIFKSEFCKIGRKGIPHGKIVDFYCPECHSPVALRKNSGSKPYFEHEHSPVAKKTEIQKKCPRYTNKADKQQYTPIDSYKIADAIPLYLSGRNGTFNLIAYFPPISLQAREILQSQNALIFISQRDHKNIFRIRIEDALNYPIDVYCKENLKVEIHDKDGNPIANIPEEVKRKWLCGISGLHCEKDIFHAWRDGGMRVAKRGFIYIGTTYRILRRNYPFLQEMNIPGVKKFKKIGELCLNQEQFIVYEITPTDVTDETIRFFRERDYILKERADEIVPLWPPAAAFGRDLVYSEDKAFFLHKTSVPEGRLEKVFLLQNDRIQDVREERQFKVNNRMEVLQVDLAADISKPIMLGGELTPMWYDVQQNAAIFSREAILKTVNVYDENHREIPDLATDKIPLGGVVTIEANLPVKIRVQKGPYILFSNYKSGYVDRLQYGVDLKIDYGAWGLETYSFRQDTRSVTDIEFYQRLLFCKGKSISMNYRLSRIINQLQSRFHGENKQLHILLRQWMLTGGMPVSALPILTELEHALQQGE